MTAELRHSNPKLRPKQALDDLYAMMADGNVSMKQRLYAAQMASRVEPLGLIGDPPPAVKFLRGIIDYKFNGHQYSAEWRRIAASALAYWERRAKQAEIKFMVADNTERIDAYRRILNGLIRHNLWRNGRWPQDKHRLIPPTDTTFPMPPHDPELVLAAILIPGQRQTRRKNIDEPDNPHLTSEAQRQQIIADVAQALQMWMAREPEET